MNRHDFLSGLHEHYAPRSYLEIGVNDGRGLARSRTRTIGVDPAFKITAELGCDLKLVKATSDDFFARPDAVDWFAEKAIDLTFVDGLHVFEVALRDFMNAERLTTPASVIVFDDMLPRSVVEAARERRTLQWTGDVFKVAAVLERYRPDLTVVPIDTEPTGLLVVVGLDPTSTVLIDNYDAIVASYVTSDPQDVPHEVMHRTTAADPAAVTGSPVWSRLAAARTTAGELDTAVPAALGELRGTADYHLELPAYEPWPRRKASPSKPAVATTASPAQPGTGHRIRKAIKRRH